MPDTVIIQEIVTEVIVYERGGQQEILQTVNEVTEIVVVAEQGPIGPVGPAGPEGPEGPQGPPGVGGNASVNISAGGSSANLTNFVLSNSNGVSFGLNGSTVTGSHNGLTAQSIQTQNMASIFGSSGDISFANSHGITFGGNNSTLTASHNGITDSTPFRLTADNSQLQFTSANSNLLGTGATQSFRHTSADSQLQFTSANSNFLGTGATQSFRHTSADSQLRFTSEDSQLQFTSANSKFVQEWQITGNTAGTGSSVQGSRLYISGGNNITLSGSSNTIVIQGGAGGGGAGSNTLGMSNIGNTAGDTAIRSGSAVQLVFAGGNNITLSQSTDGASATVTVSGPNTVAQSVQTQNMVSVQGSTGALSFSNAGGVTFGFDASTITAAAPAQTVESQSFGASNLGNTVGTSGIASGGQVRFLFAGGNNITLSQSVNGASGTITISAFNALTDSTPFRLTADNSQLRFTSADSQLQFTSANSNFLGTAATQSFRHTSADSQLQFTSANTKFAQEWQLTGNTAGTTSSVQGSRWNFSGGNMLTISGSSNSLVFSVNSASLLGTGATVSFRHTSADSQLRFTSADTQLQFTSANSNFLGTAATQSFRHTSADSQLQFTSANTKFVQEWQITGNTAGTTSSAQGSQLYFSGGNMLTLSGSSNSIVLSVNTASLLGTGATASFRHTSADSQLRFTSADSQLRFTSADSQLRFTSADSQLQFTSANTKFMQEWSLVGNTSGTNSSVQGSRLFFSGGNNITLSGSSNSIVISAPNQSNQQLSLYAASNTTQGTSGTQNASTMQFAGAGIASVGITNGSVLISVPAGGGAAGIALANSQTTYTASTAHLSGAGAITIQSTTGQSFQFSVPQTSSLSAVGNLTITPDASTISLSVGQTTYSSTVFGKQHEWAQSSSSLGQNSVHIWPEVVHDYLMGSILKIPVMISASSSAAAAQTRGYTMDVGVYTRNATNSTVLSRHYSTSYTASVSQNSNGTFNIGIITGVGNSTSYNTLSASSAGLNLSASIHGAREFIVPWATTLSPGEYWFAIRHSSSSAGVAGSGFQVSHIIGSSSTQNQMGVSINSTNNGIAQQIGMGVYSATSGALPAGISMTQINQSALMVPMYFLSRTN